VLERELQGELRKIAWSRDGLETKEIIQRRVFDESSQRRELDGG
jgi:hypothetical protein